MKVIRHDAMDEYFELMLGRCPVEFTDDHCDHRYVREILLTIVRATRH